jgi:tight adherence protein B
MEPNSGCQLNTKEKMRYYLFCGGGLFAAGYLFYHSLILSVLLPLLSIPGRRYYEAWIAQKRKKELSGQFRDLLYSLSASFSASKQMREALKESIPALALLYGEDSRICAEVEYMVRRMEESRDTEEEVLLRFADRSGDPDIESFVDIYLICRRSGGNLISVVTRTIEVLIDKLDIYREIEKLTAQKRYESGIITAIPLLMLLSLQFVSPDFLAVLYETAAGRVLMTVALLATGVSGYWSALLTRIEF